MNAPPRPILVLMKLSRRLGFARGLLSRQTPPSSRPRPAQPSSQPRPAQPSSQPRPAPLELFALEGCGACRRVRETLTELDLDYLNRSCPFGSDRNRTVIAERSGKVQVPYLIDPNTGVEMHESRRIVAYLERTYGAQRPVEAPAPDRWLADLARAAPGPFESRGLTEGTH